MGLYAQANAFDRLAEGLERPVGGVGKVCAAGVGRCVHGNGCLDWVRYRGYAIATEAELSANAVTHAQHRRGERGEAE